MTRPSAKFEFTMQSCMLLTAMVFLVAVIGVIAADGGQARRLSITVLADAPGGLQIFFNNGRGLSEANSARADFPRGESKIVLPLPPEALAGIRIDPDASVPHLQLNSVVFEGSGFSTPPSLTTLQALNEIASIERTSSGVSISTVPGAADPQLHLPVTGDHGGSVWRYRLARMSQWLLMAVLGLLSVIELARSDGRSIPIMLLGTSLLILVMALLSSSGHSVHPDEFSHLPAAKYYLGHWLPPSVLDPAIAGTYSIYGASYLNELDVVYFLAAKLSSLWATHGVNEVVSLRLFNVLLFGGMLVIAWKWRDARSGLFVLLLTPQLWYVFSYFNADALPLFLSLLAFLLAAPQDSPVSRFIDDGQVRWGALTGFVVVLGLLLVSKRNFLPVSFVLGMMLLCRHFRLRGWNVLLATAGAGTVLFYAVAAGNLVHIFPRFSGLILPAGGILLGIFGASVGWKILREARLRQRALRLGLLGVFALVVAMPRLAADFSANGSPQQKAISKAKAAEKYAGPAFRPSTLETNASASYPGLSLAGKGVSFSEVLGNPYHWASISWRSLLGVYGYMSIYAPAPLYWLLGLGLGLVLAGITIWAWVQPAARLDFYVVSAGVGLVVLSSAVHSWVNDFQAQGRYLLPALTMLGAFAFSHPDLLKTRPVRYGVAVCFLGGIISFLFTALPELSK
jgi:hypothetical protein